MNTKLASTICVVLLIASGAQAQNIALAPVAKKVSRAIEIYSSRKNVQRASPLIRAIEKELGEPASDWRWDDTPNSASGALQKARFALVGIEDFFKAKTQWKRLSKWDRFAVEEIAVERYDCGTKDRQGNHVGGFMVDRCIANAMAEAKKNRDLAMELLR